MANERITKLKRLRTSRQWTAFVGLLATAALFAVGTAVPVGAEAPHASGDSLLKQGLDFYRGQTITFIVPADPGTTLENNALAITPALGAYLHANVHIENIPAGNTVAGSDALAHATPDGLTVGLINTIADVEDIVGNLPGLDFNPVREAFLARTGINTSIWVVSPTSGYKSWGQLIKAPGPINMPSVTTGIAYVEAVLANGAFGIKAHIIPGYSDSVFAVAGFARGDGPYGSGSLTTFGPLLQAGKAVPLAVNVVPPAAVTYSQYVRGVPTIAQLGTKYPPKTAHQRALLKTLLTVFQLSGNPIITQGAVPAARVEALRAAVKFAMNAPSTKALLLKGGLTPGYGNGQEAKALFEEALKLGPILRPFIS